MQQPLSRVKLEDAAHRPTVYIDETILRGIPTDVVDAQEDGVEARLAGTSIK